MAHQKTERTRKKKARPAPGRTNPDSAGIDLGATVHYVAVPANRDENPVGHYGTLTEDLVELADWLKQCRITTVAMEATEVYWIPLFQILEDRGFEVCLVNARHVKNVPGRKSDVQDCQWLQYLHSVGLLNASFRPPADMTDCDQQIATRMDALEDRGAGPPPVSGKKGNKSQEEPMREQLCEKFGVDLTAVEGVSIQTCLAFLSEAGTDVEKFATAQHFASWMGLCPDNRITGGRTHAAHTRKVQNRLANALRMAAQSLHRSKSGLGDWFRRLKAKLGTKAAVTAAAHKLARIERVSPD